MALQALRSKALPLENNSSRCEGQALATSRFTGSRAQAIPRHVTSRFGVALCFLNLPILSSSSDVNNTMYRISSNKCPP